MATSVEAGEHALIAATLGYTTVEVVKLWMDVGPSLQDIRDTPANDAAMMQRMMDANYLGAGMALLLGGTVSYLSHSWVPLILSLAMLSFIAWWYRMVLKSDNSITTKGA